MTARDITTARAALLERHGRAYGALRLALVWTASLHGDEAKEVWRKSWNTTAPLPHPDYGAAALLERSARSNPAIALRASGLIGIDVDGEAGATLLRGLVPEGLPRTVTVQTGRGWHFWYRPPEGSPADVVKVELSAGGVEVAKDGYLVAPPARHPSGRVYSFADGLAPWDREPAVLPLELARVFSKRRENDRAAAVADEGPVREGGRHAHLRRLAGAMRRVGAGEQTIAAALLVENEARCQPPKAERLVRELARDITHRYQPGAAA